MKNTLNSLLKLICQYNGQTGTAKQIAKLAKVYNYDTALTVAQERNLITN